MKDKQFKVELGDYDFTRWQLEYAEEQLSALKKWLTSLSNHFSKAKIILGYKVDSAIGTLSVCSIATAGEVSIGMPIDITGYEAYTIKCNEQTLEYVEQAEIDNYPDDGLLMVIALNTGKVRVILLEDRKQLDRLSSSYVYFNKIISKFSVVSLEGMHGVELVKEIISPVDDPIKGVYSLSRESVYSIVKLFPTFLCKNVPIKVGLDKRTYVDYKYAIVCNNLVLKYTNENIIEV